MARDRSPLGPALAQLRRDRGITQEQVVARVPEVYGDERSYRRIERGERCPSRADLIQVVVVGLRVRDAATVNRILQLAQYEALGTAEVARFQLTPDRAVARPTTPGTVPQAGRPEAPSGDASDESQLSGGPGAGSSRRWPLTPYDVLTSTLYSLLYPVSVLLETAYGSGGPGARSRWLAACGVFVWIWLTSHLALTVGTARFSRSRITQLGLLLGTVVLAAAAQWLAVLPVLPERATVAATFQTFTGQAAHLKNTGYFLLLAVALWLPQWHAVETLRRDLAAGRRDLVRTTLRSGSRWGSRERALLVWTYAGTVLYFGFAVPMVYHLIENVRPSPGLNAYQILVGLRQLLATSLVMTCALWYPSQLAELEEQADATGSDGAR